MEKMDYITDLERKSNQAINSVVPLYSTNQVASTDEVSTIYDTSVTKLVSNEFQDENTKKINLSLDNMLLASKLLSICKNERTFDLSKYPKPVRNYVIRVMNNGNIDAELNRLNIQITAKVFQEYSNDKTTKVFLSYSWDDKSTIDWVKKLSKNLSSVKSIQTILDEKDLSQGESLFRFMERSIMNSDYIIIVCTPSYKEKADKNIGGVGYENSIISSSFFDENSRKKCIPVLAKGTWAESAPLWTQGMAGLDMTSDDGYIEGLSVLKRILTEKR